MIKIYYPTHSFKIREPQHKQEEIWDELRKIWVRLTPEEWVRQNFVQYLLRVKNYPATYMAVEKNMKLGELNKRFDLMVFDRSAHPWMLVECKAMDEKLNSRVMWQVLRYNMATPVRYIVITNGGECHAFVRGVLDFEELAALPTYDE